jgi:hypothetical protein
MDLILQAEVITDLSLIFGRSGSVSDRYEGENQSIREGLWTGTTNFYGRMSLMVSTQRL